MSQPYPERLTDCTVSETEYGEGVSMATRSPVRETLPGRAYHSEETWRIDQEQVFYRNWIYVGRAERVPKPGAWIRVIPAWAAAAATSRPS